MNYDLNELSGAELCDLAWEVLGWLRTIQITYDYRNCAEIARGEIAAALQKAQGGASE